MLLAEPPAPAAAAGRGEAGAALPSAWILTEGHAGMESQALGLAEAMHLAPTRRHLRTRWPWRVLPGSFWPLPLLAATTPEGPLAAPWPDVAISCGKRAAPVCAALRRHGVRAVHVQHPKMDPARFDVVVAARHDGLTGPNVVVTRTALHRASPERLAAAREAWAPRLAHLPRPLVAVLVGGSNGRHRLDAAVATDLADRLAAMAGADKVGLAVTPSRRTEAAAVEALRSRLAPLGAMVWDGSGDNPYFGLLALADMIVVTCDSVSMMSEAVATAAPVTIFELPGRSRRIGGFIAMLRQEGRARPFDGRFRPWPVEPMDDTRVAAAEVRRRLGL